MDKLMDISNPAATVKCWVDLYSDKMFSWAFHKINNREIAEDLVQDTFLAAYQAMDKFEGKSEPVTWLFGILNNRIADYFRKIIRNPTLTESSLTSNNGKSVVESLFDTKGNWEKEERPGDWIESDGHLLDNKEFTKMLQHCLDDLPPVWLSCVRLKYLEEKKGEFICQELGIAPTNFWQILHRSKLHLRKCLEHHWFKK